MILGANLLKNIHFLMETEMFFSVFPIIVPVVEAFVAKGIPIGTAIAFMMAVVGFSLPEATLLKKVMTWRLVGIFFATVTLFIFV